MSKSPRNAYVRRLSHAAQTANNLDRIPALILQQPLQGDALVRCSLTVRLVTLQWAGEVQ